MPYNKNGMPLPLLSVLLQRRTCRGNPRACWCVGMGDGVLDTFEYFRDNIYMTFQDDWIAFKFKDECNVRRLMWANDFPHSDATWPRSQELLAKHTAHLTEQEKNWVLHDNVAELYSITAVKERNEEPGK